MEATYRTCETSRKAAIQSQLAIKYLSDNISATLFCFPRKCQEDDYLTLLQLYNCN